MSGRPSCAEQWQQQLAVCAATALALATSVGCLTLTWRCRLWVGFVRKTMEQLRGIDALIWELIGDKLRLSLSLARGSANPGDKALAEAMTDVRIVQLMAPSQLPPSSSAVSQGGAKRPASSAWSCQRSWIPARAWCRVRLLVNEPTAMPVVPPGSGPFSSKSTRTPSWAARTAAARPLPPAPTTIM